MDTAVQVCETFVSIQGESTLAGIPFFFIRLTGCNLRCSYCDTAYAYTGGVSRSVGELAAEFSASGLTHAQVTGGEPLLQSGAIDLLKRLAGGGGTVLLETNGSRDISGVPGEVVIIMDIKCPASGMNAAMDWTNLERLRAHDEVKFVISDRRDFEWAQQLVEKHRLANRCRAVLFSPAYGRLAAADLAQWLVSERVPARINLQLHKLIWPAETRGR